MDIYLVLTEDFYGGKSPRLFSTLADAQTYRDSLTEEFKLEKDIVIRHFRKNSNNEYVLIYTD